MVAVAFAPFEPDKSRFNGAASPNLLNVVPKRDGWGPLEAGVTIDAVYTYLTDQSGNRLLDQSGNLIVTGYTYGNQLTDESGNLLTDEDGDLVLDSIVSVAINGAITLPAACLGLYAARKADGTERLFAFTATAAYEFSKTSYTWEVVTRVSGGAYAADGRWSIEQFGSVVYAANGVDIEQKIDIETGTNFENNSTAPIARYIRRVGDFMFRGNIVDHPNQLQWSALNDPQSNTAGVNLSDYQDMPEGDEIMGIVPISGGAHIWMRSAVQLMAFALNDSLIFTRRVMTDMQGTSSPFTLASFGQDQYMIYSDEGFMLHAGGQIANVGEGAVNKWFLSECDQDARGNIVGMADPERSIVWFSYTGSDATKRMLGFLHMQRRWTLADVSLQASCRARTFAYSALTAAGVDSDLLRFTVVDSNGRLSYLVGSNLAATLETNEIAFGDYRSFIGGGFLQGDPTTFSVVHKVGQFKGGTLTEKAAVSPGARSKLIPFKGDGRVHRVKVTIPAGTTWTTAAGLDLEIAESSEA